MAAHDNICNACGRGNARFVGHVFHDDRHGGRVTSVFRCTYCGRRHEREYTPTQFDIEHPDAAAGMLPTESWMRRALAMPEARFKELFK